MDSGSDFGCRRKHAICQWLEVASHHITAYLAYRPPGLRRVGSVGCMNLNAEMLPEDWKDASETIKRPIYICVCVYVYLWFYLSLYLSIYLST